ncbi:hypothetical protein AMECASPLE_033395 [Ameca splendens]|uniref:Uncharacterized protein n=1 Tax=Ameca splendens TaxID=208324 RepID=A0ABV1AFV0_9TELE
MPVLSLGLSGCANASPSFVELDKRGSLLGSAWEVPPWESILPPSPSLHIPRNFSSPAPSHYYLWLLQLLRVLGCRCITGVLRCPMAASDPDTLTYNIFLACTCRALGVGMLNGIQRGVCLINLTSGAYL